MFDRAKHIAEFYSSLDTLAEKLGGRRAFRQLNNHESLKKRGIYFFFDPEEYRVENQDLRVVRVGKCSGNTKTLWKRLCEHRGREEGGGNHRNSAFRKHVGRAFIKRDNIKYLQQWGIGSSASEEIKQVEHSMEDTVSKYIKRMSFLWLVVDDTSDHKFIESNAIILLAGKDGQSSVDPPRDNWLGLHSPTEAIRQSGLWNDHYVGTSQHYDPQFIAKFQMYLDGME